MNAPDLSVFYYAYSTIAQTLAGAFGFLVAATLYRMQWLREREDTAYANAVHAMRLAAGYAEEEQREAEVKAGGQIIEGHEADKKRIKTGLRYSLFLTSGTIVLCLLLMPMTALLYAYSSSLAWWPLGFVMVLAVITIAAYVWLVLEATKK